MAEQIIIPNLRGSMLGYAVLSGNVFVGVGRTTPWDDEDNPPVPSSELTNIEEPILYKKPDRFSFALLDDENGTIPVLGHLYRLLSTEEARAIQCRSILSQVSLSVLDFEGEISYRQIGLFNFLIPTEGNEMKSILRPNEIQDVGYLFHVSNRSPYYIYSHHGETISLVLVY